MATKRVLTILQRLDEHYGTDYRCSLDYKTPWQLLIATMLSAQCTDARVNMVTKDLFVKYPSVEGNWKPLLPAVASQARWNHKSSLME